MLLYILLYYNLMYIIKANIVRYILLFTTTSISSTIILAIYPVNYEMVACNLYIIWGKMNISTN